LTNLAKSFRELLRSSFQSRSPSHRCGTPAFLESFINRNNGMIVMTRHELMRLREWANEKLATGEEPPWAWYQYMKLRETLDAILAGMASTVTHREDSPQSAEHQDTHLRLAVNNDLPDSVRHRSDEKPVHLPM
jgi:hypothetical protein